MKKAGLLFTVFVVLALTGCGVVKEQNIPENSTENTTGTVIESTGENSSAILSGNSILLEEGNAENGENQEDLKESKEGYTIGDDNIPIVLYEDFEYDEINAKEKYVKKNATTKKMILSGENWMYTDKHFGFTIQLSKKYWKNPSIRIVNGGRNNSIATINIIVPFSYKEYDMQHEDTLYKPNHVIVKNLGILSTEEYQKQIQDKDNGRGIYDIPGSKILKDFTKGYNNSYYFVEERVSVMVIANWENIFPELVTEGKCEFVYNLDRRDCSESLDEYLFPEGYTTFFDV